MLKEEEEFVLVHLKTFSFDLLLPKPKQPPPTKKHRYLLFKMIFFFFFFGLGPKPDYEVENNMVPVSFLRGGSRGQSSFWERCQELKEVFTGEQHSLLGFKEECEPLYPGKGERPWTKMVEKGKGNSRSATITGTLLPKPSDNCIRWNSILLNNTIQIYPSQSFYGCLHLTKHIINLVHSTLFIHLYKSFKSLSLSTGLTVCSSVMFLTDWCIIVFFGIDLCVKGPVFLSVCHGSQLLIKCIMI